ncbi:MAG: molybdopterin molybdotransferase MoeA [Anaerolineaceae bacterium]|nr:molybdopterin molybdotransferase MoeA [Anaerolineaceae bacterium]
MTNLLPIREAQERILAVINTRGSESCIVESAINRVLAEDIISPLALPPFNNSSMDGYAVRSEEVRCALPESPALLPVSLDIPAGFSQQGVLAKGTAARILTGAPVPDGADAVIPVEATDQFKNPQTAPMQGIVGFFKPAKTGDNIRLAGEDVQLGQVVLVKGRHLLPQDIGLLISLGIREVQVTQKARVALFSSGDELLLPGQPMSPGMIYDANTYVLSGLLEDAGAEVIHLGIALDNPESVKNTLDQVLQNPPDLIVGSAGVSVGAFDYVREVIEANGSLSFWRVNMRPGKPVAFGNYKSIPFVGLPGNPVSAYIGARVFVLPIIRKLHGLLPFTQHVIQAVLDEPLHSPDGRESYFRGVIRKEEGVYHAKLTGHQGSGNLFSLVQANALLIVPGEVTHIPAGETISAWSLDPELT